jgi:hypothetical protein
MKRKSKSILETGNGKLKSALRLDLVCSFPLTVKVALGLAALIVINELLLHKQTIEDPGYLTSAYVPFIIGCRNFDTIANDNKLDVPMLFLLFHGIIVFGALWYLSYISAISEINILTRIKSRYFLWISKIIWLFLYMLLLYISVFIMSAIFMQINGAKGFLDESLSFIIEGKNADILVYAVMPFMCDYAAALICMALSECVNAYVGLIGEIIIFIGAIFSNKKIILARYMMVMSYISGSEDDRFDPAAGLWLCMLLILVSTAAGIFSIHYRYHNGE